MPTRFTLVVRPDGLAVLAVRGSLTAEQAFNLRGAVEGWKDGRWPVLVISDCDVVQVQDFEVDLDAIAPVPAEAR